MKHTVRNKPLTHTLRACALAALVTAHAFAAEATKRTYDVPAGDAASTLKQFASISGSETLFAAETVRAIKTNPVKGDYTPEEALRRMLEGTDLVVVPEPKSGGFAIRKQSAAEAKNALSRLADPLASGATTKLPVKDGVIQIETLEVTGSRIRTLVGEADINPVVSFSRSDIERVGITSAGELSRLIPQAYSQGSYDGIGYGGQNTGTSTTGDGSAASAMATSRSTFNLRGLGSQNTLLLIDGRRIAKSGVLRGNDASDLAGIPVSSIERVELLLGGASAVYGSDAVGGVINIILRKNYTGGELALSYENTFESDTAVRTATLSYGIAQGKLAVQLSATLQDRNAFAAVDRYFSATDNWVSLGGTTSLASSGNSFAAGNFPSNAGIVRAISGNIPGRPDAWAAIPNGATASTPASSYPSVTPDSSGFGVPAYSADRAKYVNLISPQKNQSVSLRSTYRLSDNHDLYLDARYSATKTNIEGMPVNFRTGFSVPADYPGNPFGVPVSVYKTFWELGNIQGQKTALTSNTDIAGGLRARLPFNDWRYDIGFGHNRAYLEDRDAYDPGLDVDVANTLLSSRRLELFYDSRTQSASDLALLRSMLRNGARSERDTNDSFTASADGTVWELPSGPIRLAAGGEHRTENAHTTLAVPDSSLVNVALVGNFKRNVDSVFAESRLPVISAKQQIPLVYALEVSAAGRYDTYSDIGGHTSPGFGAIYRPAKWLILRASRNHAFRAPGLQSLYRPATNSTINVSSSAGVIDRARGDTLVSPGTYTSTIGGNLGLKPEKSISDNVGVVLESPVATLKGLSLALDYQVIDYTDRLASPTLQQIMDFFPQRVTRGAGLSSDPSGWAGAPTAFDIRTVNIAKLQIEALDYQLSYRRSTTWGDLDMRVTMTDYLKYMATSVPGASPTSTLYAYPSRLTWQSYRTKGPLGLGVSGFYQEKQYTNLTYTTPRYHRAVEWNAQASYDFDRRAGAANNTRIKRWLLGGTKLSLMVNNVLNQEPPHIQGNAGFAVTDPRMARYILTLRKSF